MKLKTFFNLTTAVQFWAIFMLINLNIPASSQTNTIPFNQSNTYKKMIGERIFHGLISNKTNTPSCISCHAQQTSEVINWNPTISEIIAIADTLSPEQFKITINNPSESFMSKAHKDYNFSDQNLSDLHYYLKTINTNELDTPIKSHPKLIWFLLIATLITFALVDLLFTHWLRYKAIHLLIITIGITIHVKFAYNEGTNLGRSQGYRPDQPIKFSHQVHAGDNQIDCKYCHFNAEQGKSAGIPGPGLCMNCHLIVRDGSRSGKSEIAKVVKHFEEGKDIEWVRIHNLPEHVYFNHAQHVKVGQLDCAECHGKVEEMHILKQENDLSMGWCLDCHKKTNVQFTNNDYYSIYEDYHKDLSDGIKDSIKAVDIGANDCMKCHY